MMTRDGRSDQKWSLVDSVMRDRSINPIGPHPEIPVSEIDGLWRLDSGLRRTEQAVKGKLLIKHRAGGRDGGVKGGAGGRMPGGEIKNPNKRKNLYQVAPLSTFYKGDHGGLIIQ